MKTRYLTLLVSSVALAVAAAGSTPARAAQADLDCKLKFSLTGWAALYKHADGSGVVTCGNGASVPVKITAKGGGLTVGKYHVDNGTGRFTDVHRVSDVFGRYAQAEANAGAVKAGAAQILSKGTVSLALAGAGEGVNLGLAVGVFDIEPAK